MCIICLEFNKRKDFFDAKTMLDAAAREPSNIPIGHLVKLAVELEKKIKNNDSSDLNISGPDQIK